MVLIRQLFRAIRGDFPVRRIVTHREQITPEWLTMALRRNGHLSRANVVAVEFQETAALVTSEFAYLKVEYSEAVSLPARFFLKYCRQNTGNKWVNFHQREAQFYAHPSKFPLPAARCFDEQHSKDWTRGHLLLEDLTETHFRHWDLTPAQQKEALPGMLAQLAKVHAAWWQHPLLGKTLAHLPDANFLNTQRVSASEKLASDSAEWTAGLSPAQRALCERLLQPEVFTKLFPWTRAREFLTLEHGQPHPANFMFRRGSEPLVALLVDWQSHRTGLGAYDVAHLLHWFVLPSQRNVQEGDLVQLYYTALCEAGVAHYSRAQFELDYRWGILCLWEQLLFRKSAAEKRDSTLSLVDSTWLALEQWNCRELLKGNRVIA